jgi:hypothetical protein
MRRKMNTILKSYNFIGQSPILKIETFDMAQSSVTTQASMEPRT